jgi:hypothetical protein
MEKSLKKKNLESKLKKKSVSSFSKKLETEMRSKSLSPSKINRGLINTPRDFFLLSLSFGTGLIFFSIFVYIMIKIMSFDFMSSSQENSFEGEGESLDTLDDLLQDEEEIAIEEPEKDTEFPEKDTDENDN